MYDIKSSDLILRVSINESHADRVREVKDYWSALTNIPQDQFSKTSLIKTRSKKMYANRQNHFGTLRVKVRRSTALRRRIMGSLEEIGKQIIQ